MKTHVVLCVALWAVHATPVAAQSAKPTPTKAVKPSKPATRRASFTPAATDRSDAAASHEALVMAYRDNLVTFTKAMRGSGSSSAPVDVVVARPALVEMKRAYEQLMKHHDAQLDELAGRVDGPAAGVKSQMDARLGRIGSQLAALDLVVNDPTPNPKEVASRSAEILKECALLVPIRTKATR